MQNQSSSIYHVSDTALWIAAYRAMESKRKDSIFEDPLAILLAGERGNQMAKKMKSTSLMAWVVAIRTSVIDRLILKTIESQNIDTVINLGSGLDTRPYRLNFLSNINWFEIDFPNMINYKKEVLVNAKPKCSLNHIELDLSNIEGRRNIFSSLNSSAKNVLLISEGFISYLKEDDVSLLSQDLISNSNFNYWIQDCYTLNMYKVFPKRWKKNMNSSPFQFFPKDWFDFFTKQGWNKNEFISFLAEGNKLGRLTPMPFPFNVFNFLLSNLSHNPFENLYGAVLFSKNNILPIN
ncbi:SAM-dependent methyltransferase [Pigmentibacter sp. JX0631]|uniref:class I SAM-dependent methyltransferase n=1 Tax=Pigmentibacter sp. JX0631 TaxID=2976982 RepID=UPI0024698768|nr:SAM-dependent methyltransferase [Pigmentibacter sp. JX0631]WGL59180.1 SAM-dependent methyltransferase [Pigmentibacter sp. JX0631]